MLNFEIKLGILVDKNFNSTIRVGVRLLSQLTTMRLNAITGTLQCYPSQKSFSVREISNLIMPWEKIKVEGIYAESLCSARSEYSSHMFT